MEIRNVTMKFINEIIYKIINYLFTKIIYKMKFTHELLKNTKKMGHIMKIIHKIIYLFNYLIMEIIYKMKSIYKFNYLIANELITSNATYQTKSNQRRKKKLPLSHNIKLPLKTKYILCDFKQKLCTRLLALNPFLASNISNCSLPLVRKNLVALIIPEQLEYVKQQPRVKLQQRLDQQRLHCLHVAHIQLLSELRLCILFRLNYGQQRQLQHSLIPHRQHPGSNFYSSSLLNSYIRLSPCSHPLSP